MVIISQPTREECFTEFKKAIPELTIDPTKRQEVEIEAQQKKITELSNRDERIGKLEKKVAGYERVMGYIRQNRLKAKEEYDKKHPPHDNYKRYPRHT